MNKEWNELKDLDTASEHAEKLDALLIDKLDLICPKKVIKLSNKDKHFVTTEMKKIDRQRNREYLKRGKTIKYYNLKKDFEKVYKSEASKYLNKNIESLSSCNPGRAFKILKRLGAQPGTEDEGFILPGHENLSATESAEQIAEHFSEISQSFPPLCLDSLPQRVKDKLKAVGCAPQVFEHQVYSKILKAKKPRSGTKHDLPKELIQEFAPEITVPLTKLINKIFCSGEWPLHWKQENVVPIPKNPSPQSEDQLRPIALTPFFSKVTEHFVVEWLLEIIGPKLDFRQYGGLKGNSITHYVIEFINFVLSCQDSNDQTAVIASFVDFQKAFMRQNHNKLIEKLSDLDVPGWLLKIVIGFLKQRSMVVIYKGSQSSVKQLPGGGPQGTLLALLLFLVLVNDVGFENQCNNAGEIATSKRKIKTANELHLKYVDDLTLAEAVKMKSGHPFSQTDSKVYKQLTRTQSYAEENDMRINFQKTKTMVFNTSKTIDLVPKFVLEDTEIEVISEMRLLGLQISNDMKWKKNTLSIVKRASQRLWILRRLKNLSQMPPP